MKKRYIFILPVIFEFCISCGVTTKFISRETKLFVRKCADSINSLRNGDQLPMFLFNPCLDYQVEYWPGLHTPIPLRKLIADRIRNQSAIRYILSSKDSRLSLICNGSDTTQRTNVYYSVPYIETSFGNLLYYRLYELEHNTKF